MKKNYHARFNTITYFAISFIFILIMNSCENANSQTNEPKETIAEIVKDTIPEPPKIKIRPPYDSSKWTHILDVDATITEDMRYATTNNFVEAQMYDCPACYLRPEAAIAVGKANKMLQEKGYKGLKMFDCYRPRPIQQKLWDKVPNASYVTPPWKGSMHNKGLAVDLTIVDSNGIQLDMGTKFDFFGKEGHHTYTGHSPEILANRKLLKETMYAVGFRHIRTEWWHYSYTKVTYPIADWVWECIDD
jgi:D-alanyl-D-alanine dipeptidase